MGNPVAPRFNGSDAHPLPKRDKPQSATIRANRIPSAFAENVNSSNNSHACAYDGSGVFGRQLKPRRA